MRVPVLLFFNLSLQSKDLLSAVNAHLTIIILDLFSSGFQTCISMTVNSHVVAVSNEGSWLYSSPSLVIFITFISLCLCSKRLELLSESRAKFCPWVLKAGVGLY